MITKKSIAYLLSTGTLLGSAALFPASAEEIRVSGNGAFSENSIRVSERNEFSIKQHNDTHTANTVSVHQNTGHNSVSHTTGGSNHITTGDTNSNVAIHTNAGFNVAQVDGCNDCYKNHKHESKNSDSNDNKKHYEFFTKDSKDDKKSYDHDEHKYVDVKKHDNHHDNDKKDYDEKSYEKKAHENHDKKSYDFKKVDYKEHDWKDNEKKHHEYKSDKKDHDHTHFSSKDEEKDNHDSYKKDAHDYAYKHDRDKNHDVHTYKVVFKDHDKKNHDHSRQDCHYFLNFLYEHKGYGDYSCDEAYTFFHEHKDDHFGNNHEDKKSHHNYSYNKSHDNDKKYEWDNKKSHGNVSRVIKHATYEKSFKYANFKEQKNSYTQRHHENYGKNWYVAHKHDNHDKKRDGNKDDCKKYFTKYDNYKAKSHTKTYDKLVTVHSGFYNYHSY